MQRHREQHRIGNSGWLRAAVLGANDGLLSTASLVLGVAAAQGNTRSILVAGVAGLIAGSMSMAAGEYVSVSSQADAEKADVARESAELITDPSGELDELTDIYVARGLERQLAKQVAAGLMEHDALGAHIRDELGMSEMTNAKPVQAALSSALSFMCGGVLPLVAALISPRDHKVIAIWASSFVVLLAFAVITARVSGAQRLRVVVRMTSWGFLAMGVTTLAGTLFGARV